MTRLLSPGDGCREVTVQGVRTGRSRTYGGFRNGPGAIIEAHPKDEKALRQAGFTVASASGSLHTGKGWVCTLCGRGSHFSTCGRCDGAPCTREA